MKKVLLALLFLTGICFTTGSFAQTFSNKVVGKNNTEAIDSIKTTEYPYLLPIWGKKAAKAGFDLPYSAGVGLNYFHQKSDLIIDNLQVGFNNGPMYVLDDIVKFNEATSESDALNFRPDVWLFPFLNVYAMMAKSNTATNIDVNIMAPDSNSWNQVAQFSTSAKFDGTSIGFGLTPTMGIAGCWLALDLNFLWTDIDELDKPVYTFVFDPRLGKAFKFKKQQVLAVWIGGFRLKLNSGTSGSLPIGDLFDTEGLDTKVSNGLAKVESSRMEVETWWNNLSPADQNKPANKTKYETANSALDKADQLLASFSDAVDRVETATVQYSLDKKPKDKWNFLIGAQYQLNKHWMARGEYGCLSSRNTFLFGLQYRFGL
jgi:hypothetical protein